MQSMFRKSKRRGSEHKSPEAVSVQSENSSEPAPLDSSGGITRRREGSDKKKNKKHSEILPDKALEESVIELNFTYVAKNLPPDDAAPAMFNHFLLTDKEYERYRSLRDTPKPDYEKSEYLLGCLLRRRAGFLRDFCNILKTIEPASHIADHLEQAYKEQAAKEGFSRHRLSRMSHSDHDIRKRKVSTHSKQRCSHCTNLEMLNEKLKRSCDVLWSKDSERELQHTQQLKGQIDCLVRSSHQQLEQLQEENKELRALLGKAKDEMLQLQETFAVIERRVYSQTSANLSTNIQLLDRLSRAWPVHVQSSSVDQSVHSKAAVIAPNPQRRHELDALLHKHLSILSDGSETTDELTHTASEMSLVPSSEAEQDRPLAMATIQTHDSKAGLTTYTATSYPLQSSNKHKTGNGGTTQSSELGDTGQDRTPGVKQPEVPIQESNSHKILDRHTSMQDMYREESQPNPTTSGPPSSGDTYITNGSFSCQVDFGEQGSLRSPKAKQPLHESESLAAMCMTTELEQKLKKRRKTIEQADLST